MKNFLYLVPAATLGDFQAWVAPGATSKDLLQWPPDVFAVALGALQKSGGYLTAVTSAQWPPPRLMPDEIREASWHGSIRVVGILWRKWVERCFQDDTQWDRVPRILQNTVLKWLNALKAASSQPLDRMAPELARDLLQLAAAADEACKNVGLILDNPTELPSLAAQRLNVADNRTLCVRVRPEVLVVLPKQHTPQTGLTVRSLSHNLALVWGGEISARWHLVANNVSRPAPTEFPPANLIANANTNANAPQADAPLNMLLLPWPMQLHPSQFVSVPGDHNAPDYGVFGFFSFRANDPRPLAAKIADFLTIYEAAQAETGRIDAVVLPELALSSREEAMAIANAFLTRNEKGFFITGLGEKDSDGSEHNRACLFYRSGLADTREFQSKHHRWQLESRQIEAFRMGAALNPFVRWWEKISIPPRKLNFVTLRPTLTTAVLICEDLARQEPASELLRAVGPNLVVALLMDGPQLGTRWPSRYATVLADDPGSSVLTLTSLGMAELSRPNGQPARRVIAQWKDPFSGGREITLDRNAQAVVLSLSNRMAKEWTADGRSDDFAANSLALSGVHQVVVPTKRGRQIVR